jgi:hypothetical protein
MRRDNVSPHQAVTVTVGDVHRATRIVGGVRPTHRTVGPGVPRAWSDVLVRAAWPRIVRIGEADVQPSTTAPNSSSTPWAWPPGWAAWNPAA